MRASRGGAWATTALGIIFLALTVGCATVGRKFDVTHANEVQKGTHDKRQVQTWFGLPHSVTHPLPANPAGCTERWMYTYAYSAVGSGTMSDVLVVDFDAQGKVCDHAFSQVRQ